MRCSFFSAKNFSRSSGCSPWTQSSVVLSGKYIHKHGEGRGEHGGEALKVEYLAVPVHARGPSSLVLPGRPDIGGNGDR